MSSQEQPVVETARLILRPYTLGDAPEVQRLAGEPEVADTTLNVPHPYEDGMAETWIGSHAAQFAAGNSVIYAIVLRDTERLIGCAGLTMAPRHQRAELGYWLGVPFWNQGYMTEATIALVAYGFDALGLHKITGSHLTRNPASGRVMEKLGMTREGLLPQHVWKNDRFEDMAAYGLLHTK